MSLIYIIASIVILSHLAIVVVLFREWQKTKKIPFLLGATIWLLPSVQLYFDNLIVLFPGFLGETSGVHFSYWGRPVVFVLQIIFAITLIKRGARNLG